MGASHLLAISESGPMEMSHSCSESSPVGNIRCIRDSTRVVEAICDRVCSSCNS